MGGCEDKTGVDGGYAWVILAGCYIMYLIMVGSVKTFGILFTELDEYYGVGSGPVAFIGSLMFLLMFSVGPFANYLAVKTSFRKVAIVGGLLLFFGYSISFFIVRLELLFLSLGVSAGLGCGLTFTACSTIISFYFEKRRALANGITVSASGIGAIAFSFLYKETVLNVLLGTCSSVVANKYEPQHDKSNKMMCAQGRLRSAWTSAQSDQSLHCMEKHWILSYPVSNRNLRSQALSLIIGAILLNVCVASCLFRQPESLVRQKKETQKIKRVESGLYEEKLLNSEGNTADAEEQQSEKRCSCGPDFKLSLFKNPRFVLYWVAFMICTAGYGNNLILIPAQIRALGYDKRSVSTAVAITGGSEIVARISAGWLADKKWIRPKWIFTISYFVSAVLTFLTPHIHNLDYMYVYAATVGLFPASFWSLISVMIIDVVGMDEFPAAYGLVLPGFAVGLCVNQFAIGWIKDQTGDWEVSFYVTAMMLLIPAIMMLIEPLIIPDQKKLERENPYVAENGPQVMPADKVARLNTIDHETDSLLAGNQEEIIRHRPSKIYKAYGNDKTQADSLERTSAPLASPASI